jgi:hypothetical protein
MPFERETHWDLDRRTQTLPLEGKTGRGTVPLSAAAFKFLAECAADEREADEPLLTREDRSAWHRFAWRDAMRHAVKLAKLPDEVVLYWIRHAAISEMLSAGLHPLSWQDWPAPACR